jgi:hypothetical protein
MTAPARIIQAFAIAANGALFVACGGPLSEGTASTSAIQKSRVVVDQSLPPGDYRIASCVEKDGRTLTVSATTRNVLVRDGAGMGKDLLRPDIAGVKAVAGGTAKSTGSFSGATSLEFNKVRAGMTLQNQYAFEGTFALAGASAPATISSVVLAFEDIASPRIAGTVRVTFASGYRADLASYVGCTIENAASLLYKVAH